MRQELTSFKEEQTSMRQELTSFKEEQTLMRQELTSFKEEQSLMRQELTSFKEEQKLMRIENEQRHKEIISRFESLEADHEFTWEKTVRNEREIAKVKKQFEL
jgi:hypothetical protein